MCSRTQQHGLCHCTVQSSRHCLITWLPPLVNCELPGGKTPQLFWGWHPRPQNTRCLPNKWLPMHFVPHTTFHHHCPSPHASLRFVHYSLSLPVPIGWQCLRHKTLLKSNQKLIGGEVGDRVFYTSFQWDISLSLSSDCSLFSSGQMSITGPSIWEHGADLISDVLEQVNNDDEFHCKSAAKDRQILTIPDASACQ